VRSALLQTDTRQLNSPAAPLRRWLADRSASERATLARIWALPDDTPHAPEALAEAILRPESVTRVLASLGARERGALTLVQQHGGQITASVLEREFGGIRTIAEYPNPRAYLLALEQPPTPTERLWALALLMTTQDGTRLGYAIPPDLLELLPLAPERPTTLELTGAPAPERVVEGALPLLERTLLFLLSLGQDGLLEVIPTGGLNKASLKRIAQQFDPNDKFDKAWREDHWPYVQFARRVGEGAGLLRVGADARLRPTREALEWLRLAPNERARRLLEGWVASTWDELASFQGIKFQRAYSRDLPAAKRAILRLVGQAQAGVWVALDTFVAAVKQVEPDFARPDGRYDTWGMLGYARQSLDGFAFWDEVEGNQLRAIAGGTLRWLGLSELGMVGTDAASFRLSALGAALLAGGEPPDESPVESLVVQPNFEVVAPVYASPYARFQLGRIAERAGGEEAAVYRLTKRSIQAALERGISVQDMITFLEEQGGREPPQNVAASLREWAGQHGRLRMRRAVLLESEDAALLEQARRDKRLRMPEIERLTDTAWLLREGDVPDLAARLRKAGYGLTGDDATAQSPLREHDLTVLFAALEFYTHACATLGIEGEASMALRERVARLLPETRINRAYQTSHEALRRLKERLGEHE
jgi:hypothetical protein